MLALLRGETGADRVEPARTHALISTVNVCEVLTRQYELGWDQVSAQAAFEALELDVSAFPMSDAVSAAALRAATRHAGLSLGDRRPRRLDELDDAYFDLIVTLAPEAHHAALELTRAQAVEVEYWPTADPTTVTGARDQILAAYRDVRDRLETRIRQRFAEKAAE